jgi:hypothetical protein
VSPGAAWLLALGLGCALWALIFYLAVHFLAG